MNAGRYIRTLKYLRASQLSGQVMTRLRKLWRDPATMLAGPPAVWELARGGDSVLDLVAPALAQNPEDLAAGKFCFINQTANLGTPVAWEAKGMPRLWSYNLHYFDWLWSILDERSEDLKTGISEVRKSGNREVEETAALQDSKTPRPQEKRWDAAKALTGDWIENHLPSKTAGGWEPYPVSLRLINWALLYGVRYRDRLSHDAHFQQVLLESIGRQVMWLELNLETHIQANHLLENLAALVCVGSVFDGAEAARVLDKYLPLLKRELEEQILADGMHYERSPMYHLRMLWLVEMLDSVGVESSSLSELAGRMKQALSKLRHPDGEIALLNDAVHGVYLDGWREDTPEYGAWSLPDAGYYGYRSEEGNYLIVDAGAVGPDYQPGHAHADYLSFELSLHGRRLITDTGIGTYDTGERRSYDRSTAAHSTVEIAGENSAEVWGGFRVGRRAVPEVTAWSEGECMELEVQHDGYQWLESKALHKRRFEWSAESLQITDTIVAEKATTAISRLHFAAGCELQLQGDTLHITNGEHRYRCVLDSSCEAEIETHPSCLQFGLSQQRSVLTMRHTVSAGETRWSVCIDYSAASN